MSLPVIDAHHHFRDPARADYPWMAACIKAAAETCLADHGHPTLDKARGANAIAAYRLRIGERQC